MSSSKGPKWVISNTRGKIWASEVKCWTRCQQRWTPCTTFCLGTSECQCSLPTCEQRNSFLAFPVTGKNCGDTLSSRLTLFVFNFFCSPVRPSLPELWRPQSETEAQPTEMAMLWVVLKASSSGSIPRNSGGKTSHLRVTEHLPSVYEPCRFLGVLRGSLRWSDDELPLSDWPVYPLRYTSCTTGCSPSIGQGQCAQRNLEMSQHVASWRQRNGKQWALSTMNRTVFPCTFWMDLFP